MPKHGALLISDHPGEYVELACPKCDRAGKYRKAKLIEQYGDIGLPDLREILAKDCRRWGNMQDPCAARYVRLPGAKQ